MTESQPPNDNTTTSEDRFGRQDKGRYSGWSSALAIAIIVIVIGIVFSYVATHSEIASMLHRLTDR
jgi:hypothetical protein